jgi:hypothetical protein
VNAGRALAHGGQEDEYQSDDHDFGRNAGDTTGQLLRRTAAGRRQCVLCAGRHGEIEWRDRVRMLVTNTGAASGDNEVLRVAAFNGQIATVRAGPGNTAVQETVVRTGIRFKNRRRLR